MGGRSKMPAAERAKQFMPFAAVTGLTAALEAREREMGMSAKIELSEEAAQQLDRKVRSVRNGDTVTARYYCRGEYLTAAGKVMKTDSGVIFIGDIEIPVSELIDIDSANTELEDG
ncbi:MAG: YolD-like family protein [Eubacteriaceae bacterium]|nr:YolD-like family protein [Eubacteriaceae bacterium]